MKITFYLVSLCYLLAQFSLYAAEPIEKKIDVDQKKFELVTAYINKNHAQQHETCYFATLAPDEKKMMSVGYDRRFGWYYGRLHNTIDGKDLSDAKGSVWFTSATPINSATWSQDSAYFNCIDRDAHMRLIRIEQTQQAQAHGALPPYSYHFAFRTNRDPHATINTFTHKSNFANFSWQFTIPKDQSASSNYCIPQQTCLLNKDQWVGMYAPIDRSFIIFDLKKNMYVVSDINITTADLSYATPILGKADGRVIILNPQSGATLTTIQAFTRKAVTAVALAPHYVAALSDFDIKILSRLDGKTVSEYTHHEPYQPQLLRFIQAGVHAGEVVAYVAGRVLTTFGAKKGIRLKTIALDGEPHSMLSGTTGLYVGTAFSITRFVPKEVKDKKESTIKK